MQSALPIQLNGANEIQELPRTLAGKAAIVIAATGLVALCAHVSLPLYFTPVPLTLQNMAVILIGLALGPVMGASAMVLYLLEGAMGLPVFNPHGLGGVAQLLGPTAGYLWSYPLAAAAAGAVVRTAGLQRFKFAAAVLGGVAGSLFIFGIGAGWLAHLLHLTPGATWHMAVAPFLPGEILKVSAAAAIFRALGRSRQS